MKAEAGYLIAAAVAVSGMVALPAMAPWVGGDEFLDPRVRSYVVGFGALWTVSVRLLVFGKAWLRWRSWRRPASWSVDAADLPVESTRRWFPRFLA